MWRTSKAVVTLSGIIIGHVRTLDKKMEKKKKSPRLKKKKKKNPPKNNEGVNELVFQEGAEKGIGKVSH